MSKLDDVLVRKLWKNFKQIPVDRKTKCIEENFYIFPVGTKQDDVFSWFNENYSGGMEYLKCL